jgi:pimeloyl-ACP methyl ester carboxylesterase
MVTEVAPKITQIPGTFMQIEGIKTHFIDAGEGEAVIILHGASPGGCARVIYGPCIEPLAAAGFRVIGLDAPGYGLTEAPDDLSVDFRIRHARALATALGLDRYHLIGNSAGVLPALRLGLDDPRVGRTVVIGGGGVDVTISAEAEAASREHSAYLRSYTPGIENMRQLTLGTLHRDEFVSDELVALRYEMSLGANDEAAKRRAKLPAAPRVTAEELMDYRVPTLICWGRNDEGSPIETGYKMFDMVPLSEFHAFDNCAHWPMWDASQRFVSVVADFLHG